MGYSQNKEDEFILNYFNKRYGAAFKGSVLELGANDGFTLSNSLMFIQTGWSATLVEASKDTFDKLNKLHEDNPFVECINIGILDKAGTFTFQESG